METTSFGATGTPWRRVGDCGGDDNGGDGSGGFAGFGYKSTGLSLVVNLRKRPEDDLDLAGCDLEYSSTESALGIERGILWEFCKGCILIHVEDVIG